MNPETPAEPRTEDSPSGGQPGEAAPGPSWFGRVVNLVLAGALVVTLVMLVRFASTTSEAPAPDRPEAAGLKYLVGPAPTSDPRTWACLPSSFLLAALKALEQQPETALSPEQGDQVRAAASKVGQVEKLEETIWIDLSIAMQTALTAEQLTWLAKNRETLPSQSFRFEDLATLLARKAGGEKPALEGNPQPRQSFLDWTVDELAAGLVALESSPAPLTARQCAQLLGVVQDYGKNRLQRAELLGQAVRGFTPRQEELFVKHLEEARRQGSYDETTQRVDGDAILKGLGQASPRRPGP